MLRFSRSWVVLVLQLWPRQWLLRVAFVRQVGIERVCEFFCYDLEA